MRALLPLALVALLLPAALAAPNYTDHEGTWSFTGPGALFGMAGTPPMRSIMLKLNDGSGFSAFVDPMLSTPQPIRPPLLTFECYDLGFGIMKLRGEPTPVNGACTLSQELVGGERKFVVRFEGSNIPVSGLGIYNVRPMGA